MRTCVLKTYLNEYRQREIAFSVSRIEDER